ncbi:MAG: hypothetical protein AAFY41_12090, partial [Bacteroidota bacterium]
EIKPGIHLLIELQRMTNINVADLCLRKLSPEEIPPEPITDDNRHKYVGEPKTPYAQTNLSELDELYDYRKLIQFVRELEAQISDLRNQIKE